VGCSQHNGATQTVSAAGDYSVTASASQTSGSTDCPASDDKAFTVTVLDPEVTLAAIGNQTLCQGSSTELTASATTSPDGLQVTYTWTFPDGSQHSGATQTVSAAGDYSVTASASQASGNTDCPSSDDKTFTVTVNPLPPTPSLSTTNNTSCTSINGSITVTAPTGEGYTYTISNGITPVDNIFAPLNAGNYTVTVTDANGCSSSESATITTDSNTVDVTASANTPCVNDTLKLTANTNATNATFHWTNSNGYSSSEQNPYIENTTIGDAGTYTVTVTDSTTECSSSNNVIVTVKQHVTNEIYADSCVSYTWNDSVYHTSGDYTQTFSAANGCDSVVTLHLTIHPLPTVTISGMQTICQGATTTLTASNGSSYLWNTNATSQSINVDSAGIYSVTVTDAHTCSNTAEFTLSVRPAVTITTNPITNCPTAGTVTAEATFNNIVSYDGTVTWIFNETTVTHTDVFSTTNLDDACVLNIPSNLCNDTLYFTISYADSICSVIETSYVHVVDTVAPVITGTLPALTASGCSADDAPAAYSSAAAINALDNISISDNCTTVEDSIAFTDETVTDACQIELLRTYTLTDGCGNASYITQQIVINRPSSFTISEVDTTGTVACIALASADSITLPFVTDACGDTLAHTGEISATEQITDCEGTRSFTFHYENCAGDDTSWTFTYTIDVQPIVAPDNDTDNVTCLADTVNYPIDAPSIVNECNNEATVVSIVRTSTVDATNAGDITHTYTYTLCGQTVEWNHTYHVSPESFDPIADSVRNVFCISEISTPTTPSIVVCNTPVTLVYDSTTSTLSNGCGDSIFHYHYIVNGETFLWSYIYHVSPEDFTLPVNDTAHVQCVAEINHPTPPVVTNSCDDVIDPVEQPVDSVFDGCSGHVTFSWLYEDCSGNSHLWSSTFVIEDTAAPTFTVPNNATICRTADGTFDAETSITGVPNNIMDNCVSIENLTISFSDVPTSYITLQDTIIRTWTVSDNCQSRELVQYIFVNPVLRGDTIATACESFNWYEYSSITESCENLTHTFTTDAGCDSVVTLHLSVNEAYNVTDEMAVCPAALPYTWNGVTFSEAGTQTVTLTAANNCDSVVTMTLSVNEAYNVTDEMAVCPAALPYTWNGVTFSEAGSQTVTLTAANNCDSVVTMTLSVNEAYNVTDEMAVCPAALPYTWNGVTFSEAGTQTVTLTAANNCDSVVTLHLTISDVANGIDEQTACEEFTWIDGVTYYESTNEPTFTLTNGAANGCDSITTLHLTIHQPSYTTIYDTVNQNNLPYIFNGIECDTTGTYVQDSTDVFGCDSIITLHLVVNHNDSLAESRTVCENDLPMIWHGVEFTEAGDTTVTIPATSGADTVMTLHLLVTPLDTVQLFDTLCAGETFDSLNFNIVATNDTILALTVTSPVTNCDSTTLLHLSVLQPSDSTVIIDTCDSFVWHGITYYESTIATFDTINAAGCDSIATLDLTIRHSINPFLYDTINENDLPYVLQPYGWTFDTAGTYYLFTLDTLGCNSMITLVITVNMNQFVEVYDTVCEGDLPMPWNSLTISEAGDFMDTLLATTTADSIITLHLTVNQPSYYTDTVNTCDSFTWIDGITYTENNDTATYTLTNAAGCDSVVTLQLTLRHSTESVESIIACDSAVWHGETYYASNNTATFNTINSVNCDSTVTLNLTIYNSTHNSEHESTCDSLEWYGVYYSTPGILLHEYINDNNCPSTDTLHLTILQPTQFEDFVNACDSAIWHDSTYYTSTIDTFITTNAAGCDSLIILHLSLGVPTGTDTTVTACGSFTWHGATYTETCISTYTHLQLDDHGCERVDTLRLTILPTSETLETYTECDSLVWHSRTYYESTIDTIFETNEGGCDSLVILHLTILHPAHAAVTESACDSYSWNGQVYTESGDYTYPHLDANSCTQVDTLHLTIGHPSNSIVTDTACNSYTWHGTTYTSSTTTATFDTINAAGCDSTATLHLTILHSTESVDSRTVCDSLVWHGNTYYQSTTATFDTINAAGCDSTVTLQLTINHSNTSEQTLTECDSIVFDGTTYYESTTLTINTDNAAGCDSIATVHLIINHPEPVTTTKEVCDDYFWNGQYYNQTGIYTFQHLDANGCTQVDTLNLTFLDATTNIISLTNDFCETKNAVLQVETNLADYVWNTGETSTQITVFDDGIYTVTASQGECSIEATYTIAPCEYDILLPNAFTPNGDANNEFFSIPETHLEKINDFGFSIYIYNRYGVVVFHSTDKHFLWDGKVNGQVFHNNIYNYVIQYRTTSGVPKRLSGSVITL
jgi:gliding motility-associated-like protein